MGASKKNITRWSLISVIIVSLSLLTIARSGESLLSGPAITHQEGSFISPGGGYTALTEVTAMAGGGISLTIVSKSDDRRSDPIDAVTGIAWISENKLLYSVSPIYGIPGIFVFDCRKMKAKRILGPKTCRKGWSDGDDNFELKKFSEGMIYFYYAPDVELVDYQEFITKEYLYQINLDGTGFKKVQDK